MTFHGRFKSEHSPPGNEYFWRDFVAAVARAIDRSVSLPISLNSQNHGQIVGIPLVSGAMVEMSFFILMNV